MYEKGAGRSTDDNALLHQAAAGVKVEGDLNGPGITVKEEVRPDTDVDAGISLCIRQANERRCYTVTSSPISWAHTRNDPCKVEIDVAMDAMDSDVKVEEEHWVDVKDPRQSGEVPPQTVGTVDQGAGPGTSEQCIKLEPNQEPLSKSVGIVKQENEPHNGQREIKLEQTEERWLVDTEPGPKAGVLLRSVVTANQTAGPSKCEEDIKLEQTHMLEDKVTSCLLASRLGEVGCGNHGDHKDSNDAELRSGKVGSPEHTSDISPPKAIEICPAAREGTKTFDQPTPKQLVKVVRLPASKVKKIVQNARECSWAVVKYCSTDQSGTQGDLSQNRMQIVMKNFHTDGALCEGSPGEKRIKLKENIDQHSTKSNVSENIGFKPSEHALVQENSELKQPENIVLSNYFRRGRNGEATYMCLVCDKGLRDIESAKDHVQIHAVPKPFICTDCGKGFERHAALRLHRKVHTDDARYVCTLCNSQFTWFVSLKAHLYKDHGQGEAVPQRAPTLSAGVRKFYRRGRKGEARYICLVCGQGLEDVALTEDHARIHNDPRPFKCADCGKSFGDHASLQRHIRLHTGERRYSCKLCGARFTWAASLKTHTYRRHSSTDNLPFHCSQCSKSFLSQYSLNVHMRIHTRERPYICPLCGKAFKYDTHLKRHLNSHSGIKPHQCHICGKTFTQMSSVKLHMRIHSEEKPFLCEFCGKMFTQKGSMQTHLLTHGKA